MASDVESDRFRDVVSASYASSSLPALHEDFASGERPVRLPLGRSPRRQSFEWRLRIWFAALGLPLLVLTVGVLYARTHSAGFTIAGGALVAFSWAIACSFLFEQITRPLQTLANVVSALREDDYSFRARGARRGDAIGELGLEVNALAATLQRQRTASIEALSLVERVMASMPSPVLAFDESGRLRLLNTAAEQAFSLDRNSALGRMSEELNLSRLRQMRDEELYPHDALSSGPGERRVEGSLANIANTGVLWSVRRSSFRLYGTPHTLFVFSDVSEALRKEERHAWQRLIRVLGHEINNSLTPIKSIAGSLRTRLQGDSQRKGLEREASDALAHAAAGTLSSKELQRGLSVIEDRAASLNRFLQAYQDLTRLPPPQLRTVEVGRLIRQVAALETRLAVRVIAGPSAKLSADSDQLQQLIINLVQNAADAALSKDAEGAGMIPSVEIAWRIDRGEVSILVTDNGPGLINETNLFVPFYTTKESGTGIGLVLAQAIARAHHGRLGLANRMDARGCQAELRLPLSRTTVA